MKLLVYLDSAGQENLAHNRPLYPWHYTVRMEGEAPSEGAVLLGEFTPTFPSVEACIPAVLATLKKKEQELQAQVHLDLQEVQQRRDALLMLGHSEPKQVEGELPPNSDDSSHFYLHSLNRNWREKADCRKTGCGLLYSGRYFWGDLWLEDGGQHYLFNATSRQGTSIGEASAYLLAVDPTFTADRDGLVIRFPVAEAQASDALTDYLQGYPV